MTLIFYIGSYDQTKEKSHSADLLYAKSPAHNNSDDTDSKTKAKSKAVYKKGITIVFEEYPEKDDIGFGLEDLISKTRHGSKKRDEKDGAKSTKIHTPPLLVIIIDDISQLEQLKKIRSLPFKVTPSIFPPSQLSRKSNLLAKDLKHYMVHLPLQSASKKMNSFSKTLYVGDSEDIFYARAKEIRELFPDARFINNHTGSVFTSDYDAMKLLYKALRSNGFVFVDSRTSASTKVRKIAGSFGDPYLYRDVFLDNEENERYILGQLRTAVKIAKKKGYAIVIGHPHRATFSALARAKGILKGVKTVYMDELYSEIFDDK